MNLADGDIVNMIADNPKFLSPISTGNITSYVSVQKILNTICSILTWDQSMNIIEAVFSFELIINVLNINLLGNTWTFLLNTKDA